MTSLKASRPAPAQHPAVSALDQARAALVTEQARFPRPAWGRYTEPVSLARAGELVRNHTANKAKARGAVIGASLGFAGPLVPAYGDVPDAFKRAAQWHNRRLIDHEMPYRVPGTHGRLGLRSVVLMSEPYIADEDVLNALAGWKPRLAELGLSVLRLSRTWLIHAPDDPHSQLFIVGSSSLIR
jgi:hypothetical protein